MIHTHQVAKAVVIGLGNIALRHRRNLKLLFPEILIISVPSSGKFENQNVEFADQITLSLDEAIREEVDMAIVASPAPFHALHAKSLLLAKVPTLIEKPVTGNSQDAYELIKTQQKTLAPAAVGYCLRFMPSSIKIKELLDQKLIGCIYNASVNVDDGSCYYPTIFTTSITNCDTYAWPLNGQTYTTSGIYTNINSIPPSASPTVTGIHYTDKTDKVTVSGNYAYVTTNNSNGIDPEDEGLQIIDISTPSSPTLTGTYNTPGTARGVTVSGNYAYVADGYEGLQIVDISTPSSPTLTGTYNTSGSAYGVTVNGNYAYVADGDEGLQIIDISTPSSPTLTGTDP